MTFLYRLFHPRFLSLISFISNSTQYSVLFHFTLSSGALLWFFPWRSKGLTTKLFFSPQSVGKKNWYIYKDWIGQRWNLKLRIYKQKLSGKWGWEWEKMLILSNYYREDNILVILRNTGCIGQGLLTPSRIYKQKKTEKVCTNWLNFKAEIYMCYK